MMSFFRCAWLPITTNFTSLRKLFFLLVPDTKDLCNHGLVFHASTMYFADESALQGKKKKWSTKNVPQNSIIYLETSVENLDLSRECQLTEVDELVIETTPTCREQLTNLLLRPMNRPRAEYSSNRSPNDHYRSANLEEPTWEQTIPATGCLMTHNLLLDPNMSTLDSTVQLPIIHQSMKLSNQSLFDIPRIELLPRSMGGIRKVTYELGLTSKVKYSMSNYVCQPWIIGVIFNTCESINLSIYSYQCAENFCWSKVESINGRRDEVFEEEWGMRDCWITAR